MVNIFNTQKPRDNFAPVPANVVAPMLIRVKRDHGSGDILTQSGSSDARYLNCEITITDGPHKGAKIFVRLVVEGSNDGAKTAQAISFGLIGSIVRSAMGVKSDDMSPAVEAKLSDFHFEALDRVAFVGKTGRIERGKLRDPSQGPNGERYDDKATLACGVTPDTGKDWTDWKHAPRGFSFDDGLEGAMKPSGAPLNGPGNGSGAEIDAPPWADEA
jgi:hypothetical protein